MATDRDRFARVVDKRFNPIAYLLEVGDASCVSRISEHILMRELEADPVLKTLFNQAHRVLSRADVPLIPGSDREAAQIAQEGLRSVPATRLARAFDDVQKYGGDLAGAYTDRCVRWLQGCLETQPDWQHIRDPFRARVSDIVADLSVRVRARFLGIGDPPVRKTSRAASQADILNETIPVTP